MKQRPLAGALLLLGAVALAFSPALDGGFVWDDDLYLTANPLVTAPDGLFRIWFSRDAPSQYFPLVYTGFRLEHRLWGMRPRGYHAVNVALHAGNALLLWWVLVRLGVPAAGLAAALFALHPVQVESVAWITERKNCLSALLALCALALWLRFLERPPGRGRSWYVLSLASFALALLAKTTAAILPATLLLLAWLQRRPASRWRIGATLPFFALGAALAALSVWWEVTHQGTAGAAFAFSPAERLQIAGGSLWISLRTLLWPADLSFSYPRWTLDAGDPRLYAGALAAVAALGLLWRWRGRAGRGPFAAAAFYVLALAPTLGFVPLYTFRYAYVADHYQYLACVGPLALVAAGTARLAATAAPAATRGRRAAALPAALLVGALGALTWKQAHLYADSETLWQDTLRKHPASALALGNLGLLRMRDGRLAEARDYLERALQADPALHEAHANLGVVARRRGDLAGALAHYRRALAIRPGEVDVRLNLGAALLELGRPEEAEAEFTAILARHPRHALAHFHLARLHLGAGRRDAAEAGFREALRLRPEYADAHLGLAFLLAGSGRGREARGHFEAAAAALPEGERRLLLERARELTAH